MDDTVGIIEIASDDFARRFSMRPAKLMWFLGAGVSAAAGIQTAWDMIWRFKRELYVTQRKVSPQSVSDLSTPAVRAVLDSFVSDSDTLPKPGTPEEYSALFEATYPQEQDRRTYIDHMIRGMKPTQGHLALAALLRASHSNIVWTTNFDHLLADACARTFETTAALNSASLDGRVHIRTAVAHRNQAPRRFPFTPPQKHRRRASPSRCAVPATACRRLPPVRPHSCRL